MHGGVLLGLVEIAQKHSPKVRRLFPALIHSFRLYLLETNLEIFPEDTAQVLEYWLDVSRFSRWNRTGVKLRWNRDVFLADVEAYPTRGIRHVTTFAVWIDADYQERFGDLGFIRKNNQILGVA